MLANQPFWLPRPDASGRPSAKQGKWRILRRGDPPLPLRTDTMCVPYDGSHPNDSEGDLREELTVAASLQAQTCAAG